MIEKIACPRLNPPENSSRKEVVVHFLEYLNSPPYHVVSSAVTCDEYNENLNLCNIAKNKDCMFNSWKKFPEKKEEDER